MGLKRTHQEHKVSVSNSTASVAVRPCIRPDPNGGTFRIPCTSRKCESNTHTHTRMQSAGCVVYCDDFTISDKRTSTEPISNANIFISARRRPSTMIERSHDFRRPSIFLECDRSKIVVRRTRTHQMISELAMRWMHRKFAADQFKSHIVSIECVCVINIRSDL